jgi:hypothetical protein
VEERVRCTRVLGDGDLPDQSVVFGMRTNPEPGDAVRDLYAQHSITSTNPGGPEAPNLLESEGRIRRSLLRTSKFRRA